MPINYLDAEQQRIYNEKVIYLNNWSRRVSDMKGFAIPEKYGMNNVTSKYNRFTFFFRNWVEELLATDIELDDGILESNNKIFNLSQGRSNLQANWWNVAQQIGKGKTVENTLPTFGEITEENKQYVYDTFLPAYRALKESFDKRSIWEWFTNHAQYTAERDSLRALEGIVSTLTGEGKEGIKAKLDEYVAEIPSSNIAVSSRILRDRIEQQMNATTESVNEETVESVNRNISIELSEVNNVNEFEENKEIEDIKETESIEGIESEEIEEEIEFVAYPTNRDQLDEIWDKDDFKKNFIADITAGVEKECKIPSGRRDLYIETMAYERLINRAACNFNNAMDEAIIKGNVENIKAVAVEEIKNVFGEAYECAKSLGLSLKNRLVVAQRFSDVVLNMATPVGFQPEAFGHCGKGFMLMHTDLDMIKEVIGEHSGKNEQFEDAEIEEAYNQAHKEFGIEMNREQIEIPELMNVDEPIVGNKEEAPSRVNSYVHTK